MSTVSLVRTTIIGAMAAPLLAVTAISAAALPVHKLQPHGEGCVVKPHQQCP